MSVTIATAVGPVVALDLIDGYTRGIAESGPFVRKKYQVPWAQADAVSNAVMGLSTLSGGIVNGTITRSYRHRCPESPNLIALSVGEYEGVGAMTLDDHEPKWDQAIIPVTYGPPPFAQGDGGPEDPGFVNTPDQQSYPFVSFELDSETEIYEHKETSYKYVYNGKPIGVPFGVRVSVTNIVATLHQVPWLPLGPLLKLKGNVNSRPFMGQAAQFVLFEKFSTKQTINTDGTYTQELVMHFKHRNYNWNTLPKPDDGSSWVPVTHNGSSPTDPFTPGNPPYFLADLRPCFLGLNLS